MIVPPLPRSSPALDLEPAPHLEKFRLGDPILRRWEVPEFGPTVLGSGRVQCASTDVARSSR